MKPTDESRDTQSDFAGDESTSVMGVDLLSSLTERSRRIDVAAATVPEPEISIVVDEVEPVTTVSPATRAEALVVDGEYPAIGDEESTVTMDEPEPTTVAIRARRASPPPPPEPPPALPFVAQPLAAPPPAAPAPSVAAPAPSVAAPAPSLPDPQWAAELRPRHLPTMRVAPLPTPLLEPPTESAAQPAVGSRQLSMVAAIALGVAAWTLGLGHHELLPASATPVRAASVSGAAVAPTRVASAHAASPDPARPKPRPTAPHRQRI